MDDHFVERHILRMGSYQINNTFSTAFGYEPLNSRNPYGYPAQVTIFSGLKEELKRWVQFTD